MTTGHYPLAFSITINTRRVLGKIILYFTRPPTNSHLSKSELYSKRYFLQQQVSSTSQSPNEFTIIQERMVLKKNLPTTAAIILDFTIPHRIHNWPRADGINKKTCPQQQQVSSTSQSPNEFTIFQERMVLKKNLSTTAASILYVTIPQRIHNCPRTDGINKNSCPLQKQLS